MRSHELAQILLNKDDCEIAVIDPEDGTLSEPILGARQDYTVADEKTIKIKLQGILETGLAGSSIGRWPKATEEQEAAVCSRFTKVTVITIS